MLFFQICDRKDGEYTKKLENVSPPLPLPPALPTYQQDNMQDGLEESRERGEARLARVLLLLQASHPVLERTKVLAVLGKEGEREGDRT